MSLQKFNSYAEYLEWLHDEPEVRVYTFDPDTLACWYYLVG